MKYPETVMRVVSEEVERHADDEEGIRAAMARVSALPVYGVWVEGMMHEAVVEMIMSAYESRQRRRLTELFGELVLGKESKLPPDQLWADAAATMLRLGVRQERIDELLRERDPDLLEAVIKELEPQE
jgi:hypothetical protein